MRIAMLAWESLHSVAVGGVAQHVTELAAALHRQGHDVHVFTRIAPGQSDYHHHDGVHYYRCTYPGHNEFVDDVNNMCRAFVHRLFGVEDSTGRPFDIVHAHDWLVANAMIWVKKARPRRGIFTVHATEYARSGNVFHNGRSARVREQERAGTYWADHVIAVSHTTRKEIMWMYEVPDWKSSVVYNGVTRQRFDHATDVGAVRRRYDLGPMDPVVLFCGRLDYQKGPDILLEAFPEVLRNYRNAKLVFAGDGGMRQQLERRAAHLGVAHAVRFLGYRGSEEIVEIFKLADVVAIPSRNEPFGIVVLEAWCAAKPVLVTHTGGPSEYVTHGENGLRIYDNPNSVSWGIHQLFGDFERARWMGANGRKAVDHGFTWDLVADQTLNVYDPDRATREAVERAAEVEVEAAPLAEPERVSTPEPVPAAASAAEDAPQRVAEPVSEPVAEPVAEPAPSEAAVEIAETVQAEAAPRDAEPALVSAAAADEAEAAADEREAAPPLEIELALRVPGDHAEAAEQLRICEQVMDRWRCRPRHDNGALIVGGDWQTLFDAMRETCRTLGGDEAGTVRTRLIITPECPAAGAAAPSAHSHDSRANGDAPSEFHTRTSAHEMDGEPAHQPRGDATQVGASA